MEYLSYPTVLQGTVDHIHVELDQGHPFEVKAGQFVFDPTVTSCSAVALSIYVIHSVNISMIIINTSMLVIINYSLPIGP